MFFSVCVCVCVCVCVLLLLLLFWAFCCCCFVVFGGGGGGGVESVLAGPSFFSVLAAFYSLSLSFFSVGFLLLSLSSSSGSVLSFSVPTSVSGGVGGAVQFFSVFIVARCVSVK